MPLPRFQTITEQVAAHLRGEILAGRWGSEMPGQKRLAARLGVSGQTVELALQLLGKEGLLVGQGAGRCRRIVLPEEAPATTLRVAVLDYDEVSKSDIYMTDLLRKLENAGHRPFIARGSLMGLHMDVRRVAALVARTEADAWVIRAASSEVLRWFAQQKTPAFAFAGLRSGVPIAGAGTDMIVVFAELTRRLTALGHTRISFLCGRQLRLPQPGRAASAFLDTLASAGIATGAFNLPDWDECREGFECILDSLFGHTPPTALILDEPFHFHAAYHHLAGKGLQVPRDVSLVCTHADPGFDWCQPPVSHIRWDYRPMVRRTVSWANNVAKGKDDRRPTSTKAEFVEGGTIGPAAKGR